jgi:hypothetical protein
MLKERKTDNVRTSGGNGKKRMATRKMERRGRKEINIMGIRKQEGRQWPDTVGNGHFLSEATTDDDVCRTGEEG